VNSILVFWVPNYVAEFPENGVKTATVESDGRQTDASDLTTCPMLCHINHAMRQIITSYL